MGAPELDLHRATPLTPADASPAWADALGAQTLAVTFVAELLQATDDGGFVVRTGAQRYEARCALGCLVEPEAGDQVACWRFTDADGADVVHIVAVLTRPAAAGQAPALRLRLGEHASLAARDGALTLHAPRELQLRSEACAVEADRLEVRAQSASLVYRSMQAIGELCQATIGQLKLVGAALTTVFDHQHHHAQQHRRVVDGLDLVDAQVLDHRAKELLHLQGETVLANGERLVKVRGTQIHLG